MSSDFFFNLVYALGIISGICLSILAVLVGKKFEVKINQKTKQFGNQKPIVISKNVGMVNGKPTVIKKEDDLADILDVE